MPYNSQGQWVSNPTAQDHPDDPQWQRDVAGMDLLDVFGFQRRHREAQDAQAADANRGYWDTLRSPSVGQLMGPEEDRAAQMAALGELRDWARTGVTAADRGALEASRQRDAQASRGTQQALMQQAQARGTGGSALDFATRQQASQQGQTQAADAESQMLASAQQRQLAASQAYGQAAGNLRSQDVGAAESAFDAAAQRAAGATGQYGTDSSLRSRERDRQQEDQNGLLGLIGGIASSI